jgi:hypothetical protein
MRTIYILLLTFVVVFAAALSTPVYGQYYISLEQKDPSGVDIAPFQAELNTAAQKLCVLFDSLGFQNKFKVFSAGFYVPQEAYKGYGYAKVFDNLRERASIASKYYLLIGRESTPDQVFERFWIDIVLPDTGKFVCTNQFYRTIIRTKLQEQTKTKSLELDLKSNVGTYSIVEKDVMDSLLYHIRRITNCCVGGQPVQGCMQFCPSMADIKATLLTKGFVGVEGNIGGSSNVLVTSSVEDYSGLSTSGILVRDRLIPMILDLAANQTKPAKCYITDNNSICMDNNFELVEQKYNANMVDYDIWVHLLKSSDNTTPDMVFVKCEQYILADDEEFFEDDLPAFNKDDDKESLFSTIKGNLIIDPKNMKFYYCDSLAALPKGVEDVLQNQVIISPPTHVVNGSNETLETIANLEGGFTAQDLRLWNPEFSGYGNNQPLPIFSSLKIHVDAFNFTNHDQEEDVYGLIIPFREKLTKYKTVSNTTLVRDFFSIGLLSPTIGLIRPDYFKIPSELIDPKNLPPDEVLDRPSPIKVEPKIGYPNYLRYGIKTGALIVLVLTPGSIGNADVPEPAPLIYYGMPDQEEEKKENTSLLKYVTYTKTKPAQMNLIGAKSTHLNIPIPVLPPDHGHVYIGRSRGYGHPKSIVQARDRASHGKNIEGGYKKACLDHWTIARKPVEQRHTDPSYMVVRGREQNIMEMMGGTWVSQGVNKVTDQTGVLLPHMKLTRSGNEIAGVNIKTPYYYICTAMAMVVFPNPAQGILWNGVCP